MAGLKLDGTPYLNSYDTIGCPTEVNDYAVIGTCQENLHGMCESYWQPDLDKEQLFETLSQCLLAAVDRDAFSGWGGQVTIITPEGTEVRDIKMRMD